MRQSRYVLSCLSAFVVALGCGGGGADAAPADDVVDGAVNVPVPSGGSTGSGGAKPSGGSTGSGGASGTGGSQAAGGSAATGGSQATGGATGSGGSAGNDGGPPHVVGTCNGLGAVNAWENITPAGADLSDNGIVEILTDPMAAGTIYTSADKQGIFRSTDCGATFAKINTGRNGAVLDTGTQWSMAIDRADTKVLYAGNLYGTNLSLFKSVNGGVDWDDLFPPGSEVANTVASTFVQEVSMDPTDPKHLVVSFHNNCTGAYAPMCLSESKDAGSTWRLFKGPAGGWVENARPIVLDAHTLLYATALDGLFYSGDSGGTWAKVGAGAGHQIYRAKDGNYYLGTAYGVARSSDGRTWTQIQGSPNSDGIIGDGQRMFTGWPTCCGNTQPFWTASETDGTTWTKLPSPDLSRGRFPYFAYEADHHVLYVATSKTGLWRMVTR
jgi:hypothetical protein